MNGKLFATGAEWKSQIPVPVFEERPEYNELYWKAWELAHDHLLDLPGMPQNPYMDEAFCDCEVWIWDTCFMSLFCKYAQNRFPGVETLNNFYEVLYGKKKLPHLITKNAPDWTGHKIGQKVPVRIHIFDNPPLFAWAELSNAMMSGDRAHVRDLLLEKKYLQQHFERLEKLVPAEQIPQVSNKTFWVKHQYGYFWEGGSSGMDNTPRGRTGDHAQVDRPNHPRMLWLDAIVQQGLVAKCIVRLAELIGELPLAAEWQQKFEIITAMVNRYYWDENDGFYYDIHADTLAHMKVMTIASFWPLLAGMPDPVRAEKLISHLRDPRQFGGSAPLVSLARDDADFNAATGEYWRGSVWVPTAYMTVKGLENYGYFTLARDTARKVVEHMYLTFRDYAPHTIWECYNPSKSEPAHSCGENQQVVRPDFCGWSALAPIGLYLENVIGIYSADAFAKVVKWQLDLQGQGKIGVRNFRFGDTVTDLVYENGVCEVSTNLPYQLVVNDQAFDVNPGTARLTIAR